ncbi:MAG: bifunctional [glutamine synthetase] adenylyltransferase/[glutamine synthetase]-adenylyl-L-tyrosine phosphorylase [Alphaproteobacteria bacterium]|nr:bifunctional [glutamine synthetase] adenylyltransferase/[glutamine synthetase]-adenylyl-L-tyrosine phosphorylase [Alphaproteobacteria bacterium]
MSLLPFIADIERLPKPADAEAVARGLEQWGQRASELNDHHEKASCAALASDRAGRALLSGLFGNSPFLSQALLAEPTILCSIAEHGFATSLGRVIDTLGEPSCFGAPRETIARNLRIARRRVAMIVALADLCEVWPLERVTGALSAFADAAIQAALSHLLKEASSAGQLPPLDPLDPTHGSGIFVVGMGKLGARELNYSSDVDLIILYDSERLKGASGDAQQTLQRLTRQLVTLLSERTQDGYVLRVDLRLRPDPGSTPLAISTGAAETYYETLGQNWERAAMIKARPVAGDLESGHLFLSRLRPFVWRKHLDFAAIQDIHSIKRQINAHKGHLVIALLGHDIKVGRGGIREIEFYAQTQQLIWGGRVPELRVAGTCPALRALATIGQTEQSVCGDLIEAYRFLRRTEHRIQMVADEQRHHLPPDDAGFGRIATFLGHRSGIAFGEELTRRLETVERHYAALFEDAPELGSGEGNLVFTGTEDDPDTLKTLSSLGFRDGSAISACVRGWHHGRIRATRSTRARELLTELMPALLKALGRTVNPDAAFMKFDEFLSRLPAGVQLFSLFYSRPALLDEVAEVMGSAPRLAEHLSRRVSLLEGMLSGDFDAPVPSREAIKAELEASLAHLVDFQDVLDGLRRYVHDGEFQIGMQLLRNRVSAAQASRNLSDLADAAILTLLPRVEAEFARAHGVVPGGAFAVLALGKLGSQELTFDSDLDLVFVYDAPEGLDSMSDGERPLAASQYYARLSQRLTSALTALTAEGRLYQIDTRLRPSGNAGPVASEVRALEQYHTEAAWTFEHMALTRARVLCAPPPLAERIGRMIRAVLHRRRDPAQLVLDVADMRVRIEQERATSNPWMLKHSRGGLLDLEFIAQYLALREGANHPAVLDRSAAEVFDRLGKAGVLGQQETLALGAMCRFFATLQILLRLTVGTARDEAKFPVGVRQTLARATEMRDFNAVRRRLMDAQAYVRSYFERTIERPAALARQRQRQIERKKGSE